MQIRIIYVFCIITLIYFINVYAESFFESLKLRTDEYQACQLEVLKDLGWSFIEGEKVKVNGGNPCDNSSLKQSKAEGELTISLPREGSLDSFLNNLDKHINSLSSMCSYKFNILEAINLAMGNLTKNDDYTFHFSRKKFCDFPKEYWTGVSKSLPTCLMAKMSAAMAINCLYHSKCAAECVVGLQTIQYATQYELYGHSKFDKAFLPEELVVGA